MHSEQKVIATKERILQRINMWSFALGPFGTSTLLVSSKTYWRDWKMLTNVRPWSILGSCPKNRRCKYDDTCLSPPNLHGTRSYRMAYRDQDTWGVSVKEHRSYCGRSWWPSTFQRHSSWHVVCLGTRLPYISMLRQELDTTPAYILRKSSQTHFCPQQFPISLTLNWRKESWESNQIPRRKMRLDRPSSCQLTAPTTEPPPAVKESNNF